MFATSCHGKPGLMSSVALAPYQTSRCRTLANVVQPRYQDPLSPRNLVEVEALKVDMAAREEIEDEKTEHRHVVLEICCDATEVSPDGSLSPSGNATSAVTLNEAC